MFTRCHLNIQRCVNVASSSRPQFETLIGLEVHVQLKTKSKLFSAAPVNEQGSNQSVALFDMGTPGTLPTLNKKAVKVSQIFWHFHFEAVQNENLVC